MDIGKSLYCGSRTVHIDVRHMGVRPSNPRFCRVECYTGKKGQKDHDAGHPIRVFTHPQSDSVSRQLSIVIKFTILHDSVGRVYVLASPKRSVNQQSITGHSVGGQIAELNMSL